MKKLSFTSKSQKRSKKAKKKDKSTKKSSKKEKGDRSYWQPLGGAKGAYRDRTYTGSFTNAWSGENLRGWDFTGILDPQGGGGDRLLLSNSTKA
jgi:hypothetical protein